MKESSQEFAQDTKHLFCFCPWLYFPLSHINTSFLLLALSNTRSAQVSEWRLDEWMDSFSHFQENIVSVPDYSFHFLIFQAFSLPSFVCFFFLNFLLFSSFLLSFSYLSLFFFFFHSFILSTFSCPNQDATWNRTRGWEVEMTWVKYLLLFEK